jgi:hypothetical protein
MGIRVYHHLRFSEVVVGVVACVDNGIAVGRARQRLKDLSR